MMDNLELQRDLDEQLRSLRIQLKLHENKVKNFETKASKEERKAKRRRDDFGTIDSQKKIKSAVSVVTKSDGGSISVTDNNNNSVKKEEDDVPVENVKKENNEDEEYAGNVAASEGIPKHDGSKIDGSGNNKSTDGRPRRTVLPSIREGRLFSSLLQGTLESFNKQATEDKVMLKRKEVEQKIEERVASEQKNLLEAERQKTEEEKQRCLEKVAQVKEEIKSKELQLSKLKLAQHQQLLSGFLKTKANPPIYFYPSKTDEFTERVLSTKKKIEPPKEPVAEETNPTEEVPVTTTAEGDDVEVEAFTREREAVLPLVQQQEEEEMDEGRTEDDGKKH